MITRVPYDRTGAIISDLRTSAKFSAMTLAKQMNCSPQYLYGVEAGRTPLSLKKLLQLVDALGLPVTHPKVVLLLQTLFEEKAATEGLSLRVTVDSDPAPEPQPTDQGA